MMEHMLSLWGFLALIVSTQVWYAEAAPIPPPDLWQCEPIYIRPFKFDGPRYFEIDCCVPTAGLPVKDFKFDLHGPLRVRKSAHEVDAEFIEKYNRAYEIMRALPPSDPRSFHVQSNIHCGYCAQVYKQQNSSQLIEVHRNWLLLPFHRWYIYFHEKILGSLIGDPTFAIPFWNWDNQSTTQPFPNSIPEYFTRMPALYDRFRDPRHQPPSILDLHWGPFNTNPADISDEELRVINHNFLHQTIVSGGSLPELFLGGKFRFNDPMPFGASSFEIGPHAAVHSWVGNQAMPQHEDMAPAYSAARDPLFYTHHSNVDRLWEDWKKIGGRRGDLDDSDWLNSSFYFYDEHADLVRVTVAQALEMEKLRYTFDWVDNAWLQDMSVPLSSSKTKLGLCHRFLHSAVRLVSSWQGLTVSTWLQPSASGAEDAKFSGSPLRARATRPHALHKEISSGLEEVLHIEDIRIPSLKPVWFDIFINLPEADEHTPLTCTEWAGRFMNGPHLDQADHMKRGVFFKVSIGQKLKKLGIADESSIAVTLVPKGVFKHEREIRIKRVRVDLM